MTTLEWLLEDSVWGAILRAWRLLFAAAMVAAFVGLAIGAPILLGMWLWHSLP